jgi:hypothetical protein
MKVLEIRFLRIASPPPTAFKSTVVRYALGIYKVFFIGNVVVET